MKVFLFAYLITLTITSHAQSNIVDNLKKYVNESFSISYPNSWRLDTSKTMGVEFFIASPKENDSDKFSEILTLLFKI